MTYKIFIENEYVPVPGDHEQEIHDYLLTKSLGSFSFGSFQTCMVNKKTGSCDGDSSDYMLEPTSKDHVYYIKDISTGKYLNASTSLPIIPPTKENVLPVSISDSKDSMFLVEDIGGGLGVSIKESTSGMFLSVHEASSDLKKNGIQNVAVLSHYNPTKMKLIGTEDKAVLHNKDHIKQHVRSMYEKKGKDASPGPPMSPYKIGALVIFSIVALILLILFLKKRI